MLRNKSLEELSRERMEAQQKLNATIFEFDGLSDISPEYIDKINILKKQLEQAIKDLNDAMNKG